MRVRDILEIENVQGRYMYMLLSGNFEEAKELFADRPDTTFSFMSKARTPFVGRNEIYQKMFLERMVESFPEYDRFHAGGQTTVPYIDVNAEGTEGFGMFPSFGFFVRGKVFDIHEPPYPVIIGYGMWCHEFVKENGRWQIHHFHTGNGAEAAAWQWHPGKCRGYAGLGIARQMPRPPMPYEMETAQ